MLGDAALERDDRPCLERDPWVAHDVEGDVGATPERVERLAHHLARGHARRCSATLRLSETIDHASSGIHGWLTMSKATSVPRPNALSDWRIISRVVMP